MAKPHPKKPRRTREKVENPAGFLATHDLKQRGWTARMIEKLLGEHDRERPNGLKMGRRRLPPVKLYAEQRVEEQERTEDFILARFKAEEAREKHAAAKEKRLRERRALLEHAAESYAPKPKALPIRRGAVRKARQPHLPALERKLAALAKELGGLKTDEEALLRELMLSRLHTALARTYDWYSGPTAPAKAQAGGTGAETGVSQAPAGQAQAGQQAQPSDWRKWDWD